VSCQDRSVQGEVKVRSSTDKEKIGSGQVSDRSRSYQDRVRSKSAQVMSGQD